MAKPGLDSGAKSGLSELKARLLFVLGAIVVFRLGSYVPIPGIDPAVLADLFEQQKGTIVEMFNMFSGGALERASVLALGIMPYITASIIMQLLSVVHPPMVELKKEYAKIISKESGKTLKRVMEDIERDNWMNPDQAIKYGIADKVMESKRK